MSTSQERSEVTSSEEDRAEEEVREVRREVDGQHEEQQLRGAEHCPDDTRLRLWAIRERRQAEDVAASEAAEQPWDEVRDTDCLQLVVEVSVSTNRSIREA